MPDLVQINLSQYCLKYALVHLYFFQFYILEVTQLKDKIQYLQG